MVLVVVFLCLLEDELQPNSRPPSATRPDRSSEMTHSTTRSRLSFYCLVHQHVTDVVACVLYHDTSVVLMSRPRSWHVCRAIVPFSITARVSCYRPVLDRVTGVVAIVPTSIMTRMSCYCPVLNRVTGVVLWSRPLSWYENCAIVSYPIVSLELCYGHVN